MSAHQNTATIRVKPNQVILTLSGPDGATAAILTPEGAQEVAQHLTRAAHAAIHATAEEETSDGS